ncbi:MAG: ATP-binding protein [Candidatus Omnitrophota bacterium]
MKLNSVRFKISVLYVAILGVILVTYSAFLYLSLHYTLYDELDDELHVKVNGINSAINLYKEILPDNKDSFLFSVKKAVTLEGSYPDQGKMLEIDQLERLWLGKVDIFNLREDFIAFMDQDGKVLVNSRPTPPDLKAAFLKNSKLLDKDEAIYKSVKHDKKDLRVITKVFIYNGKNYYIHIATSLKPVIHLLRIRLAHILTSIPIILIIASFIGQLFATRILTPVLEITKTAENITHEDLSLRVKSLHADSEMKYLVDAFNDMIARLEKSFKYIAEFSSYASHELKTPLAIIRGESEVALRKDRDIEEYKRVIRINIEETERMLKLIEDLLLLTKLDYKPEVFKFERFDLVGFLKEIYEQTELLSGKKNIEVTLRGSIDKPIFIKGDRLHLRRLFFNLISNAIKFSFKDGRIDIRLNKEDKKAVISISDIGIGIDKDDIPHIFNKFFHKDTLNEDDTSGNGLGLSIAQSIVNIHQGYIGVKSVPNKGSTFTVFLPIF